MKSYQKLVFSGGESINGFGQLLQTVLPDVKKANQEFFEKAESEAKHLIETDTKVHLKKIGDSVFKLLEYAGYADSRKSVSNDNRRNVRKYEFLGI